MSLDTVKDKIKKLLRVAENDASTDGEIANAIRAARQMMMAHHLEEHDLSEDEKENFERIFIFSKGAKIVYWERALGSFIQKMYGSVGVYTCRKQELKRNQYGIQIGKGQTVHFYGPSVEVESARETYVELREIISTLALLKWGTVLRKEGRGYCEGFVQGLINQLNEQEKQLEAHSTSTALVLQNRQLELKKLNKAKDWLAKAHGIKLSKTAPPKNNFYNNAYQMGKEDGKNYSVAKATTKLKLEGPK